MDHDGAATPSRGWALPALLVVLLAAVLATSTVLLLDRRDPPQVEAVRPADVGARGWTEDLAGRAVVAARRAAATYFTLDHRHVRADLAAMRALGTEEFVAAYDAGARELAERVSRRRLVLTASLVADGAATEFLVADRAQVLVSLDVTTEQTGARRTSRFRTRVALTLIEGRWRVSSLEEVG